MEMAVKEGYDVVYIAVDLLVLGPGFIGHVASGHTSDVALGSDHRVIRNLEFQLHPERCPAALPLYR